MSMFRITLLMLFSFLFIGVISATPLPRPAFRADLAQVSYVEYCGSWYPVNFDFKVKYYVCNSTTDEHGSWTGEFESWDAATSTLVVREAYVVCKPDDLPQSGPVHLVRFKFFRCPTTLQIKAEAEGGSWSRGEVVFR